MKKRRINHETDSGVFADVSFLLLIFFMVVTTFNKAYELQQSLPPKTTNQRSGKIAKDRILSLYLNGKAQVLVEGEIFDQNYAYSLVDEIRRISAHPKPGVVKINMLPDTPYKDYVQLLTQLKKDKEILLDQIAQESLGKEFTFLESTQKKQILYRIKYTIIENEIPAL